MQYSGGVGKPRLAVTKDQLPYLINNDFSAKDIAAMLNISDRTVHRRFQEFWLSIRASYSVISDLDLDALLKEVILEFPNIGYRRIHGELERRKILGCYVICHGDGQQTNEDCKSFIQISFLIQHGSELTYHNTT